MTILPEVVNLMTIPHEMLTASLIFTLHSSNLLHDITPIRDVNYQER